MNVVKFTVTLRGGHKESKYPTVKIGSHHMTLTVAILNPNEESST